MADAFSAWQPILDRVKAQVPGLKAVLPAWDLASIEERSQVCPAAFVLLDHELPIDSADKGAKQMVAQRFLVVLSLRNAQDTLGGTGIRNEAGTLLRGIAAALSGWAPTPDHRPLKRIGGPRNLYTPGYAYLPLGFETRTFFP